MVVAVTAMEQVVVAVLVASGMARSHWTQEYMPSQWEPAVQVVESARQPHTVILDLYLDQLFPQLS